MKHRPDGGGLAAWLGHPLPDTASGRGTERPLGNGTGTGPTAGPAEVFTGTAAVPPARPPEVTAAPRPFPSAHEQAAHELGLATALVLNDPRAGSSLELLVNDPHVHPEGALVLGCLLSVTDRIQAAQFWWQFAAGSGSTTAAYLLHLYHQRLGETRDAAYWRSQAEDLANTRGGGARPGPAVTPLLPERVRHDLLVRCHHGLRPRLPPRLEAVINGLAVDSDDEDFGEVPQPSRALVGNLAAGRRT
ncbi:hypothetical protein ACIPYS_28810 [Kitasatospora sp. NPDC089913]|uniref:hypothetical protein n=1 Tax=Kitasatospora sp. NPDC089913 TaxID=3364080 RepID=UPI0038267AC4